MENNNNRLIQHNSPSETRCVVIVQSCSVYSQTCLKRTLKGPENFSAKGSFRLIKVHYIQYKKLSQDMHVLN